MTGQQLLFWVQLYLQLTFDLPSLITGKAEFKWSQRIEGETEKGFILIGAVTSQSGFVGYC